MSIIPPVTLTPSSSQATLTPSSPQATSGKPSCLIWVGGLPETFSKSEVEQVFDNFGAIASIMVSKSKNVGSNFTPGYAFIEFKKK